MSLRQSLVGIGLWCSSIPAFADRYGIGEEYQSFGGLNLGDVIGFALLIIVGVPLSYLFLLISWADWAERKKSKAKPNKKDGAGDWIFALIGYAFVALVLSYPITFITKLALGAATVREYYWLIFFAFFGALIYFRES